MRRKVVRSITAVGALGAALTVPVITAGSALAAGPAIAYVAPSGASNHTGTSCVDAKYKTVQSGVDAVRLGGMVYVCAGTYHESVSITKQLTLQGAHNAIIDATGFPYGVGVGAAYTTVTGLVVQNASGD